MIDPSQVDLSSLPAVNLSERLRLPATPCVYLAIDSCGNVQYVGRSVNPRARWAYHHRYDQLECVGGIRLAYLSVPRDLLDEVESAFILYFRPPLNEAYPSQNPKKRTNESVTLSIDESEKARLEEIALEFGQTWGDRPNISLLNRAISQGKLKIDWADPNTADSSPRRAAMLSAIALIQEGLSKLTRLI